MTAAETKKAAATAKAEEAKVVEPEPEDAVAVVTLAMGGAYEPPAGFEGHTAFNPADVQHIS